MKDLVIGNVLNPFKFFRRHWLRMREVEPRPVRRNERSLLRDVFAQHLPQRLVQKMVANVVPNGVTTRVVDLQQQRIADLDRPLSHRDHVSQYIARFFLRVAYGCAHALAPYFSSVPDLPATFAVKRRLVHHHGAGSPFFSSETSFPSFTRAGLPSALSVSYPRNSVDRFSHAAQTRRSPAPRRPSRPRMPGLFHAGGSSRR